MIKKILLMAVNNDRVNGAWEEIGICYIASYLRKKGYEVKLIQKQEKEIDFDIIREFKPDVVGFDIYEVSVASSFRVAKKIRELFPEVILAAGGPYPTYCHEELLMKEPLFHYCIRGEGEYVFWELLETLNHNKCLKEVKGITYIQNQNAIVNRPQELIGALSTLPLPARDILRDNNLKVAMISTSRGCYAACSFCSNQLFWKKWRGRDAVSIVDEIQEIAEKYDIFSFNFTDASFEDPSIDNYSRLRSIANELIGRQLDIAFHADFRAEFQRNADDELISLLFKAGLRGVYIGIEAFNDEDLRVYTKIATVEDNCKVIEMFRKHNISTSCGIINFNPYSTFDRLHENIKYMKQYGIAGNIEKITNRYRMYKETKLYERMQKDGLLNAGEVFSEVGYNFLDENIGELADYVTEYIEGINEKFNFPFVVINNFSENYISVVRHFYIKAQKYGNEKSSNVIMDFINASEALKQVINDANANWFYNLLKLAESGWNKGTAREISEKMLAPEFINDLANQYKNLSKKLYIGLIRSDKRFVDIIDGF